MQTGYFHSTRARAAMRMGLLRVRQQRARGALRADLLAWMAFLAPPPLFLAEWRPGDADWLRRWAWPRPERWCRRLDEWTPLDLRDQRRRL